MRKIYQTPALLVQLINVEGLIALSKVQGDADETPSLTKEQDDWNIWSEE